MKEEIYKNLSLEDLPGEVWKEIPDTNGLYFVSNLGRVKSIDKYKFFKDGRKPFILKGRIIKQFPNWQGYLHCIILDDKGRKKHIHTHKVVCDVFNPNPDNYPCVNHKDENKQNNRSDNLEHCTYSYNITYGSRKGEKDIPIVQYELNGEYIRRFNSTTEASSVLGINRKSITNCINGWSKSAGGYMWRKEKDNDEKEISPYIHLIKRKVICYDLSNSYVASYESITEAARMTNLCKTCISHNCHGKRNNVGNFIFKFA